MQGNSTSSKGSRQLDARTTEGRRYRNRVGKAAFAKARRDFTTVGKVKPAMGKGAAPAQVKPAVKPEAYNWASGQTPTLPQIEADIAYREETLAKIKGLRD